MGPARQAPGWATCSLTSRSSRGYNKRLRAARGLVRHCARALAASTSLWSDDVWVVDSTPVECARSRETVRRSELAGWAQYGYCASHSRWFWGLRLHLVTTLHGLPVGVRPDRGESRRAAGPARGCSPWSGLVAARPGQVLIGDKNYYGRDFEESPGRGRARPAPPGPQGRAARRAGSQFFRPLRQVIESVNQTFKGQLDLERHGGRTADGVTVRVLQRILALTAAIWHNDITGQPVMRSLVAYDH